MVGFGHCRRTSKDATTSRDTTREPSGKKRGHIEISNLVDAKGTFTNVHRSQRPQSDNNLAMSLTSKSTIILLVIDT